MPEVVPSEVVCEKVLEDNTLKWQFLGVSQAFLDAFSMGKQRGRATDFSPDSPVLHVPDDLVLQMLDTFRCQHQQLLEVALAQTEHWTVSAVLLTYGSQGVT
ncbi:unnamed protein product [Symbiodinium natans]|uniref:Uncharacterized protein n=1 Tax=Symbiodinium natans TaxID=878477 RepID=A0A812MJM2_9DINO|nr:unnamed protein product [Symbiodinium natans]